VIAIIGLVIGISIPAFQGSGQGAKARTAAFQLSTHLNLARQHAITTRQNVFVLFAGKEVTYTAATRDMAYSTYMIVGERDGMIGEVRRLPPGVIFDNEYEPKASPPEPYNIFLQTKPGYVKSTNFPTASSSAQNLVGFTYRPDGRLHNAGFNRKSIFITEGWLDDAAQPTPLFNTNAAVYGLEIQPVTGHAKTREYNIVTTH